MTKKNYQTPIFLARGLFLISSLAALIYAYFVFISRPLFDLRVYAFAAHALAAGVSPYAQSYSVSWDADNTPLPFLYPPSFLLSLTTLFEQSDTFQNQLWTATSLLVIPLISSLLLLYSKSYSHTSAAIVTVLILLFPPTIDGLDFGQVHLFVLLCIVVTITTARTHPRLAGIAVGIATAIKITPFILIIPFLRKRRYDSLIYFIASLLLGVIIGSSSSLGFQIWIDFLNASKNITNGSTWWSNPDNFSPARLLGELSGFSPPSCNFIVVTICCIILFLLPKRFSDGRDLLFATTLLPLISPILWFHHLVWLVPVIFLLGSNVRKTRCIVLLGCVVLLLSFSMPCQVYLRVIGVESIFVGATMIYLANAILWSILILFKPAQNDPNSCRVN